MEVRSIDNAIQYYYDISGKQTVKSIFEKRKITYSDLKVILLEIYSILQQTKSYLIDEACVVLEADYIYCNFECTKLELLFYIDYESEERNIFTKLAEYLIEQIDHEDEDAVSIAYKFYQNIRKENFILEQFLVIIQEKNKEVIESVQDELVEVIERESDMKVSMPMLEDESIIKDMVQEERGELKAEIPRTHKNLLVYVIKTLCIASIFWGGSTYVGINFPFYKTEKFLLFVVGMLVMIAGVIHYIVIGRGKEKVVLANVTKRDTSKDKFETIISRRTPSVETYHPIIKEIENGQVIKKGKNEIKHTKFMGKVGQEQRILKGRIYHTEMVYTIKNLPCIIGKLDGNADIVITHDSISRIHARITERENRLYIEDLNSTNGTYKNGIILETNEEVLLEVKDEIQIGGVYLEYR